MSLARDVDVPLGERAPLVSKKMIHEVTVRDPSLVTVVVADGAVSLEGKEPGVTGITVKYADGEHERLLVVVGEGRSTSGPRREPGQTIDLKQSARAQAKAPAAKPK
ncbi:MAG: pilus assembly protein N-terminal domain-containing protein [Myxococcaceae bacterium]|nr:pilus assembly protein N-terminal domain-containing protein [Myxococcaceae bacterium]